MSEWTTEEPEAGRLYWLSIHPDKRIDADYPAVEKCHVDMMHMPTPAKHVKYDGTTYWYPLDNDRFKGAQWKLVDPDPADPFADKRPSSSRDNDFM